MRRRLRAERERRGLSLRKLAAEVGISPSALSQIETGRSRPSVSTLYTLVSALGLSLDALFAPGREAGTPAARARDDGNGVGASGPYIKRARGRESLEFRSGVRWEQLNAPGDAVEVLWLTYEPGSASGPAGQFMRHSGHEYGVVLSGRLSVSIWFDTYELGPGDAISFPSTAPHQLRALGPEPAHALWFLLADGARGADVYLSSSSARPSRDT
jgi:transcriptional regulator with XRE-family HTH domain